MSDVSLRRATTRDAQDVLTFWARAAEDAGRPSDSVEDIRRLVQRDPDGLMLAFDGDDLVGTIVIGWDGWRCHLYRLAVDPDHRREGIARRLLDHAEARFTGSGGKRADAMVLDANELGQSIWAAAGYTRQPDWSRWVKYLR